MVELARLANSYAYFQREDGYCRKVLCLRVSGRKLMQLAEIVMLPERFQPLSIHSSEDAANSISIGFSMAAQVGGLGLTPEMDLQEAVATPVCSNSHTEAADKTKLIEEKGDTVTRHAFTFQESWVRIHGERRDYLEGVFYRALYPHARWVARGLRRFYRAFFAADFEIIRWISSAKTVQEMRHELECYRYRHPEKGLLRRRLKLRISSERLVSMAASVLPRE